MRLQYVLHLIYFDFMFFNVDRETHLKTKWNHQTGTLLQSIVRVVHVYGFHMVAKTDIFY